MQLLLHHFRYQVLTSVHFPSRFRQKAGTGKSRFLKIATGRENGIPAGNPVFPSRRHFEKTGFSRSRFFPKTGREMNTS